MIKSESPTPLQVNVGPARSSSENLVNRGNLEPARLIAAGRCQWHVRMRPRQPVEIRDHYA